MSGDVGSKFAALEEAAERMLLPSSLPSREVTLLVAQCPSFSPWRSWILARNDDDTWSVRRVTWMRGVDSDRARDPLQQVAFMISPLRPTLAVSEVRIGADRAARWLAATGDLTQPLPAGSSGITLDGERNLFVARGLRLDWNNEGPPPWRDVTNVLVRLRDEMDAAIPGAPEMVIE